MDLSDSLLDHLRHVAALPDLGASRYVLGREIGRGGMGVVYAAHDRDLDRQVALKVLDSPLASEARLIAHLEHPAVVPIYEAGALPDGRFYYTMKLVSGERLDRYARGPASLADRLRVIRRVTEVLAFAHNRDVIHRDLKPQNIMVGPFGEVYVMDWGVEGVAGTTAFRAPETCLDHRSEHLFPRNTDAVRSAWFVLPGPRRDRCEGDERRSRKPISQCNGIPRGPRPISRRTGG